MLQSGPFTIRKTQRFERWLRTLRDTVLGHKSWRASAASSTGTWAIREPWARVFGS